MAMALGSQPLDILGDRQSGQDVRTQNITACQSVSNIVKTSLGPVGLDKMLVDDIGDVTITNDGATILKMLDVEHPAAKVLVELAELQDREVGDGTTSVVIVAAELLKRANDLVKNKIHPTSVISGYRLAMREACKYVEEKLAIRVDKLGKDSLVNCAKTSMSSKLLSGDSDFFANLVVEAVQAVKMTNARGEIKYPIKGINILKAHGKSAKESYLLKGYALNTGRAAQGMPMKVSPARIACLDFNLQKTKMQLGVQVLVTDPRELEKIRQREADMTKERIEKILKAGANVVLTTKGIDDMALKYFVEAGAIAVRRVRKEDLRHVAKATGATAVSTFADMEGEETFDASFLGYADEVVEERIADDDVILIKGTKTSSAVSVILRGANDFMLDEMDRALHDALCIVKRTLESNSVVAGGGAVEAALSVYLEYLATTLGSREQLAIAEFAESLLIIPKVLAVNAAKDATDLVAKLRAYHHTAQTKADKKHLSSMGLDLVNGTVRNNLEAGVIEPAMSKVKILQFATEAAITILRIDDMIKLAKDESQDGQE
ncbi:T-complex protein 1 subunit alpha-like [Bidens hawaiensis]|uniref:T-complex protein 1 subunit alpha-like n=1 Tax=Bidens hawaiensis TaxID=980011 RepID=UPI00404A8549